MFKGILLIILIWSLTIQSAPVSAGELGELQIQQGVILAVPAVPTNTVSTPIVNDPHSLASDPVPNNPPSVGDGSSTSRRRRRRVGQRGRGNKIAGIGGTCPSDMSGSDPAYGYGSRMVTWTSGLFCEMYRNAQPDAENRHAITQFCQCVAEKTAAGSDPYSRMSRAEAIRYENGMMDAAIMMSFSRMRRKYKDVMKQLVWASRNTSHLAPMFPNLNQLSCFPGNLGNTFTQLETTGSCSENATSRIEGLIASATTSRRVPIPPFNPNREGENLGTYFDRIFERRLSATRGSNYDSLTFRQSQQVIVTEPNRRVARFLTDAIGRTSRNEEVDITDQDKIALVQNPFFTPLVTDEDGNWDKKGLTKVIQALVAQRGSEFDVPSGGWDSSSGTDPLFTQVNDQIWGYMEAQTRAAMTTCGEIAADVTRICRAANQEKFPLKDLIVFAPYNGGDNSNLEVARELVHLFEMDNNLQSLQSTRMRVDQITCSMYTNMGDTIYANSRASSYVEDSNVFANFDAQSMAQADELSTTSTQTVVSHEIQRSQNLEGEANSLKQQIESGTVILDEDQANQFKSQNVSDTPLANNDNDDDIVGPQMPVVNNAGNGGDSAGDSSRSPASTAPANLGTLAANTPTYDSSGALSSLTVSDGQGGEVTVTTSTTNQDLQARIAALEQTLRDREAALAATNARISQAQTNGQTPNPTDVADAAQTQTVVDGLKTQVQALKQELARRTQPATTPGVVAGGSLSGPGFSAGGSSSVGVRVGSTGTVPDPSGILSQGGINASNAGYYYGNIETRNGDEYITSIGFARQVDLGMTTIPFSAAIRAGQDGDSVQASGNYIVRQELWTAMSQEQKDQLIAVARPFPLYIIGDPNTNNSNTSELAVLQLINTAESTRGTASNPNANKGGSDADDDDVSDPESRSKHSDMLKMFDGVR